MDNALLPIQIKESLRTHPYQTLLIAAGVGYVLGGGAFTRLTYHALRVGAKVGVLPSLKRGLLTVALAALSNNHRS